MKDFWDMNNDGKLDLGEECLRDATYLSILNDAANNDASYSGGSSAPIATGLGNLLLIVGILLLLGTMLAR